MKRVEKIKNMSREELIEFLTHSSLHYISDKCGSIKNHRDRLDLYLDGEWDERDYTKNCLLDY